MARRPAPLGPISAARSGTAAVDRASLDSQLVLTAVGAAVAATFWRRVTGCAARMEGRAALAGGVSTAYGVLLSTMAFARRVRSSSRTKRRVSSSHHVRHPAQRLTILPSCGQSGRHVHLSHTSERRRSRSPPIRLTSPTRRCMSSRSSPVTACRNFASALHAPATMMPDR